jgi:hypothetical protein
MKASGFVLKVGKELERDVVVDAGMHSYRDVKGLDLIMK